MDWFVKAFIKASVAWLVAGITLGVAMAVVPTWTVFRPAHLHMNLLGFVAMMIFGVAYHVIPRFAGVPLYSSRAATLHWYVANAGLLAMTVGFMARGKGFGWGALSIAVGGILVAIGGYTFAFLIWRTIDRAAPKRVGIAPRPVVATAKVIQMAAERPTAPAG